MQHLAAPSVESDAISSVSTPLLTSGTRSASIAPNERDRRPIPRSASYDAGSRVGEMSYVRFELPARLGGAPGDPRLTSDLADCLVYSPSVLPHYAKSTEERRLVTRGPASEDKRSAEVEILDERHAVLAKLSRDMLRQSRRIIKSPHAEDMEMFARAMIQVSERLRGIRRVVLRPAGGRCQTEPTTVSAPCERLLEPLLRISAQSGRHLGTQE